MVAPLHFHAWVEFGNRLINAVVTVAALGAFAAAWRRAPRRRDLTLLAGGLVVGLLAEVALGALVVKYRLAPGLVMTHFLLGLVFLADAVLLHHRAAIPDEQAGGAAGSRWSDGPPRALARLQLAVATAVVVTLGTVVTSTGPHGGDPTRPAVRLLAPHRGPAARHLRRGAARPHPGHHVEPGPQLRRPGPVMRRAEIVLIAMVAQAAVGYTQYFNGDPVGPGRRARRRGVRPGGRHAALLPGPDRRPPPLARRARRRQPTPTPAPDPALT